MANDDVVASAQRQNRVVASMDTLSSQSNLGPFHPNERRAELVRYSRSCKLSIVVPVFNEAATVADVVADLLALAMPTAFEVIVVDDGSDDETPGILGDFRDPRLRVLRHQRNQGKGAALRTGLTAATGTHVIPFDADSEYDTSDLPRLMTPVLQGRTDVVYGARIPGMNTLFSSCWYPVGSWLTTWVANVLFRARVKDLHTCLKLVPLSIVREMPFREEGFGLDTELTTRLLKMGLRPFEVPVSYHGRSREEGKKIKVIDGVRCLAVMARVRFSRSAPSIPPASYQKPRPAPRRAAIFRQAEPPVLLDVVLGGRGQ